MKMRRKRIIVIYRRYLWMGLFIFLLTWAIFAEYNQYAAVPVAVSEDPIYHHPTREKEVALTFNVDWGEEYLTGILNVLAEHNSQATFFLTGKWAEKNPELVKKIIRGGHQLGNHGFWHAHPKELNDAELRALITDNANLLEELSGERTDIFAPPYGEIDERIARIAAQTGHRSVMWSIDTIDWQRPAPVVIIGRVLQNLEPGAIILAHPTEPTLEALPAILQEIKNEGYKLSTVGELISKE